MNSHAHYDHAGRHRRAPARRATPRSRPARRARGRSNRADRARTIRNTRSARASNNYPAVGKARAVADGEVVRAGSLAITAHLTPGHTPGSTTWTWKSCEGESLPRHGLCRQPERRVGARLPFHRLTPTRADRRVPQEHRDDRRAALRHPGRRCTRRSPISTASSKRRTDGVTPDPFIDPQGCRTYAADAAKRLDARVAEEAK